MTITCTECITDEVASQQLGGCRNCFTCQREGSNRSIPTSSRPWQQQRQTRDKPIQFTSVTAFPTNDCNLRCDYCFIYKYERKFGSNRYMTMDTAKRMITWLLASSGSANQISVHWFGGEPLVAYPLIKEATEWAVDYMKGLPKSIRFGMTSNMTLIDDEVNEFLKKYNYGVLCSIDGNKQTHDAHRVHPDGSGSWDEAISGLKRIMSWMKEPPTVRWTVAKDGISSIVPATRDFWDMGIINIAHEFVYEVDWEDDEITAMEIEFEKLIPDIIRNFKKGTRLEPKFLRDGSRGYILNRRMSDRCGLIRGDIGVDVDGNLFRCHRFIDQYEHHVGDIWKGIDFKKAKEMNVWDQKKIRPAEGGLQECFRCPAFTACNGGCLAVNWDTTGDIYKPPLSYCKIQRMKFRLATRFKNQMQYEGLWNKWISGKREQTQRRQQQLREMQGLDTC